MIDYKRLIISVITGAILGIVCIIGVGLRVPGGYAANVGYLIGIWTMRVILGIMIGLDQSIILIKGEEWQKWVNAGLRGILFGLIVSVAVLLMDKYVGYSTFAMGIVYGLIIDLVATFFTRKKKEEKKKKID